MSHLEVFQASETSQCIIITCFYSSNIKHIKFKFNKKHTFYTLKFSKGLIRLPLKEHVFTSTDYNLFIWLWPNYSRWASTFLYFTFVCKAYSRDKTEDSLDHVAHPVNNVWNYYYLWPYSSQSTLSYKLPRWLCTFCCVNNPRRNSDQNFHRSIYYCLNTLCVG